MGTEKKSNRLIRISNDVFCEVFIANSRKCGILGTIGIKRSDDLMVSITELAAEKVKEVLKQQNKENSFLRLYLVGVG